MEEASPGERITGWPHRIPSFVKGPGCSSFCLRHFKRVHLGKHRDPHLLQGIPIMLLRFLKDKYWKLYYSGNGTIFLLGTFLDARVRGIAQGKRSPKGSIHKKKGPNSKLSFVIVPNWRLIRLPMFLLNQPFKRPLHAENSPKTALKGTSQHPSR